jgi:gluconolactonase
MRCGVHGNGWYGNDLLDGVHVFAPAGPRIGRISLPERCANVCFGGLKHNHMFMAASQSRYALRQRPRRAGWVGKRSARQTPRF